MTNFDFLLSDPQFEAFASAAVAAERIYSIDAAACAVNCRRAMEFAVKWMYAVDDALEKPYDERLASLLTNEDFREIVGNDLLIRMEYIRKTGNDGAHKNKVIRKDRALLCLQNLYYFMDFVACCYGEHYTPKEFDPTLPEQQALSPAPAPMPQNWEESTQALIEENKALKAQLSERRAVQQKAYIEKPLDLTEYETRKLYIDAMLSDAGWQEGKNWLNEVHIPGMPNNAEEGRADYVLYDDMHRPLAVVEAKRTCADPGKGRVQASLYADQLERDYGRRPVIFLTNGFATRINDGVYPERAVSGVYSKRDLEKLFNLRAMRTSIASPEVNRDIAGRWYQEAAIKAVCQNLLNNRRKALLVMATGSGKTRTAAALCDVLLRHGWVENILFLADRTTLVTQAKRSFAAYLPNLSVSNLCETKPNYSAHCIFSTYQTMMNCIDNVKDGEGRLFTPGHFDFVICDEAHRSIYNKYRDIFDYFDAPLLGLTATPKSDIDKNTYQEFEIQDNMPTYAYDLAQAVKDGFLVDYVRVETKLKFLQEGIVYDDLPEDEKQVYEDTFTDENGALPKRIEPEALNSWLFNDDTIRKALALVMEKGLKINYGETIGKTIIFAKSHRHANKILEIFNQDYPHLPGYAQVIDNYLSYAQTAVDQFSDPKQLPQIAISVDMLDTGIDIPEVLNLVFFKRVMSRAKIWQMIGRGTRLCPGLLDGSDKKEFYIFDLCGNFEFFNLKKERECPAQTTLQSALFTLKAKLCYQLQDLACQTDELTAFRKGLVQELLDKAQQLNRKNFAVQQHLREVERFSAPQSYEPLSYEDTLLMEKEVAPLVLPDKDEASALRFDALLYGMELAILEGRSTKRACKDVMKKAAAVAKVANIPEVRDKAELLKRVLHTNYLETAGVTQLEQLRGELRGLMKYVRREERRYQTNFTDEIVSVEWKESDLEGAVFHNYKAKAEMYLREHQDNAAVQKLRTNIPLTQQDVAQLEQILWNDIGTRADYEAECGKKPLGEFVREIVGMDMTAAKNALAEYLADVNLDSRQIYFVNQIVEYIVKNGLMKDLSVLQEPPFTDCGSVVEVFDDLSVWAKVKSAIDRINANAAA